MTRRTGTMARMFASTMLASFVLYAVFFGVVSRVRAVAPANIVNYQGRLLNANSVPVVDATAAISFAFYTASSGGTCAWSNSSSTCASVTARTITLTDGLFSENLGDTTLATPYAAINDATFSDNAAIYLEVIVNGETLTPRKRIVAAPYALNASTIDGFNSTQVGGTSALALVLDTNGNLQLTGSPQGSGIAQGSLYINPVAANIAADEILFAAAVEGSSRFSVDEDGDTSLAGTLAVGGGTISSSLALALTSSGGDISVNPNGSGIFSVTSGDDFVVGASVLAAPFSVDESLNTVRIGDGVSDTSDPKITFYASDASDSGTISFTDSDYFDFAGGNVVITGNGLLPSSAGESNNELLASSTFTGTSGANLNTIVMNGVGAVTVYSAIENATSTDHVVAAANNILTISGSTATVTNGFGSRSRLVNTSTNASLVQGSGYVTASESEFTHNAAATTLAVGYGARGSVLSAAGTLTKAVGVYGQVATSAGTVTAGYGGEFVATASGSTRYGVYAEASGGAANYAGYFTGSVVQIDANSTPDTATYAIGAGDLFVSDLIEMDGSLVVGDGTGDDQIMFNSGITTANGLAMDMNALTSGKGIIVTRADDGGAGAFSGTLLSLNSLDTSGGAGDVLTMVNNGGAGSVGLYITQGTTSAHDGANTGNNALVIDVTEGASADDVILMRSNVGAAADTEFRVTTAGDAYVDGAFTGGGADFAEFFLTSDTSLSDRQIVCQGTGAIRTVVACEAGDDQPMGVVSTNPAFIGNNIGDGTEDYRNDPRYRLVGLVGQVDTLVNAADGAIAVGDPISTSPSMKGYGAKSHGPSRIVGFALEPLASGTGTIRVLVQPQWYGGDVLASDGTSTVSSANIVMAPMHTATTTSSGDSRDLVLRGSGWDGTSAVVTSMSLRNDVIDGSDDYQLSVVNSAGSQVAYVGSTGDLAIAGKLYPSDRGTLQTSKYVYYDGSGGAGGDFMRTNASGWGSGSYDFAEMFPSQDLLAAGEVVVFADQKESIRRSTGMTYDDRIAGVVSTRPGFLAGDNKAGDVPVALAGRVPTYVSGENGAIAIGDPLTTSSKAGYAMKATEPGPIVGYAMDSFSGATGVVTAFIRPSYFDGNVVEAPVAENVVSNLSSVAQLDVSGSMNMNGGSIISVASLAGIGGNWRMMENGDLVTRGSVVALIRSFAGEDVETYAALGREHTVQLSGTATLRNGMVKVEFEKVDPAFNDIISNEVPYRVFVTPAGMSGGVYVAERSNEGFTVRDAANTNGVAIDWLVIAYHKDFAPAMVTPDVLAPETVSDTTVVPEVPVETENVVDDTPTDNAEVVADDVPAENVPVEDVPDAVETTVEESTAEVVDEPEQQQQTPLIDVTVTAETSTPAEGAAPTPPEAP